MINNMEIPIFTILVKKKKKEPRPILLSVYFAVENVPSKVLVEVFLESLSSLFPFPIYSFLFAFPNQTSVLADSD